MALPVALAIRTFLPSSTLKPTLVALPSTTSITLEISRADFLLDDSAVLVLSRRFCMLGDLVDAFNDNLVILYINGGYLSGLSKVFACDNLNGIALLILLIAISSSL